MEILQSLGLNETAYVQFAVFIVAYFFISKLLFKPYLAVYIERERATIGSEGEALETIETTKKITGEYEQRARLINDKIKLYFDKSRGEAEHEHDLITRKARLDSEAVLKENRQKIIEQVRSARENLKNEIPIISKAITAKLLGKDLGA